MVTEGVQLCDDCACCASGPDGSRLLSDICAPIYFFERYCTYGCLDGYRGRTCRHKCPEYCTRCAQRFNFKKHKDYMKCYLCANGYYNGTAVTNCSTHCPVNCVGNQCNKTTGYCLNGCSSEKWTGNKCEQCSRGFYGMRCDKCPNCLNGLCDRNTSFCDGCIAGYFGQYCNITCPENCADKMCDQDGGECSNCSVGYYGPSCDLHCAKYCINETCIQESGICMHGRDVEKRSHDQVIANDRVIIGAIVGGVVGGLGIIALICILFMIHLRRRSKVTILTTETAQTEDVAMDEQHTYDGLVKETMNDTSVYSDLQTDVVYVNTEF